jgi:hypothetical protein
MFFKGKTGETGAPGTTWEQSNSFPLYYLLHRNVIEFKGFSLMHWV